MVKIKLIFCTIYLISCTVSAMEKLTESVYKLHAKTVPPVPVFRTPEQQKRIEEYRKLRYENAQKVIADALRWARDCQGQVEDVLEGLTIRKTPTFYEACYNDVLYKAGKIKEVLEKFKDDQIMSAEQQTQLQDVLSKVDQCKAEKLKYDQDHRSSKKRKSPL